MSRLTRDWAAMLRRVQMSASPVWVLCEGPSDRNVYDKVAEVVCRGRCGYIVATAKELTGAGGKPALLNFYDHVRKRRALARVAGTVAYSVAICVDKDIDDVLRKLRKSAHVIYTELYSCDNYLVESGGLVAACAEAAGLARSDVATGMGQERAWIRAKATQWREWIELCVLSTITGAGVCSYSARSAINQSAYGDLDETLRDALLDRIRRRCEDREVDYERARRRARRVVESVFDENVTGVLFNGKWYEGWIRHDLARWAGDKCVLTRAMEARLQGALAARIKPMGAWAAPVRAKLARVVQAAGR